MKKYQLSFKAGNILEFPSELLIINHLYGLGKVYRNGLGKVFELILKRLVQTTPIVGKTGKFRENKVDIMNECFTNVRRHSIVQVMYALQGIGKSLWYY